MSGDHRRRPQGREFNAVDVDAEEGIPICLAAPAEAVSPQEQGHCFNDRRFSTVVSADNDRVLPELDEGFLIPRKFLIFRVAILMAYIS